MTTLYNPEKLSNISRIEKGESITILAYGATGTGKTEFAATAEGAAIINCGLGIATIQSPGFRKRNPNVDPLVYTITEEALPANATAYDEVCDVADALLARDDVHCLVLDDVTALRRFALNKGLEVNQATGKSNSLTTSRKHDARLVAVQDYGIEMDLVEQFVIGYTGICKSKNKHFIMLAHERLTYGKASAIGAAPPLLSTRPGFTGQTFPDSVTGHFDFVWHFYTQGAGDQVKHKVRTKGDSGLIAKTRWDGVFPVILDSPTFPEVLRKIRGS